MNLLKDVVLKQDIYFLCSDRLKELVEDDDISLTITKFSDNLTISTKQLIANANQKKWIR
ncbi:MAG: serine/threonine protein phosphatase PrpC [Oleiphilaceae bacterium]|jgi:serine/threonine protein phosphatase PrpC